MRALLALALALAAALCLAAAAQADLAFEQFSAGATTLDGSPDLQAGSHPYALTLDIAFAEGAEPGYPAADPKNLEIDLPAGLAENATSVAQCTIVQFHTPRQSPFEESASGESCPIASQVGVVGVRTRLGVRHFGVFNLLPPPGIAAEIGFAPYGMPIVFSSRIRESEGSFGFALEARNLPQTLPLDGLDMTLWGTPWAVSHNPERGNCLNETDPGEPWAKCSVGPPRQFPHRAYLTMPTSCEAPLAYTATADSWQAPAVPVTAGDRSRDQEGDPHPLEGCDRLPIASFSAARPTTEWASSPTGFEFDLEADQQGLIEPGGLAPSQIRNAVVSLPEGMTINPSVGAGLGVCTESQLAAETAGSAPGAACPNESKIGDFRVESPLFEQAVNGSIFLAQPFENPFGALIGVYLVAKVPQRGIIVKVGGELVPDQSTGRITARFENLPQLPYSNLRVFFREGQRAPLASPSVCGSDSVQIDLTPWVDPNARFDRNSEFAISQGVAGGPCPPAIGAPFSPGAVNGSVNPNAGSYSAYYLHLTRQDTEQEITSYSATLPPGLTGKLAGIPTCSDAAIAAAKASTGLGELDHPSCPSSSEIGHTVTGYGLGGVLDYAPGRLYLGGPYRGAPLSIVAVDSALVGPFDLGVIVVRSALRIDPRSAQVTFDTAGEHPFPHIVDGIPLHLRDLRIYISRPEFTLNPTSCEPFGTTSTLVGAGTLLGDESDDVPADVLSRYQVANCSALPFGPKLTLKLKGPARRGAFPQLRAEVRERGGDANIGRAVVTLPHAEYLAQGHLNDFCSLKQFRTQSCPAGSVYGHARAFTPLLSEPLEGPVYLRSSEDAARHPLPDLVAALRGDGGIEIDVVGHVSSHHGGMRATYEGLPDAPASRFVLTLDGAGKGLLQNSQNLCSEPAAATAQFAGQNNRGTTLRVPLQAECKKKKKRTAARSGGAGG